MPANEKRLRILVVEDDAVIGELLAEMLGEMGHDVCGVEATEANAVLAAARCLPDLMIVDAWLGLGSGVEAMSEICSHGFVPHVFISGQIAHVRMLRPNSVMIQKPFSELDLSLAVSRAMAAPPPG